jgi:hypothetical protein
MGFELGPAQLSGIHGCECNPPCLCLDFSSKAGVSPWNPGGKRKRTKFFSGGAGVQTLALPPYSQCSTLGLKYPTGAIPTLEVERNHHQVRSSRLSWSGRERRVREISEAAVGCQPQAMLCKMQGEGSFPRPPARRVCGCAGVGGRGRCMNAGQEE